MRQLTDNASLSYEWCRDSTNTLAVLLFTIRTDIEPLKWIINLADATSKLVRWHLQLSQMEFDIVHLAEIKHQAAEALLGLPKTGEDCNPINDATTLYQSCRPAPYRETNGKDASNSTMSLTTAMILMVRQTFRDYPLYSQLRRQGRKEPHKA